MHPPRIIHFHPSEKYAPIFLEPLMVAERSHGYASTMVNSAYFSSKGKRVIPYDICLRNLPALLIAFIRICLFLKSQNPSVVISHNAKSSSLPLFAAWLMGVRSRVYYNHGVPFIAYRGLLRYLLMGLERVNCLLATNIITVSSDMRDVLLRLMPEKKITIIGHGSACGLDLSLYGAKRYTESSFRKDHGISMDDFVVVFVGRPESRKGYNLILRLWQDYLKEDEYKLIICGSDVSDALRVLPKIPSNIICMGFTQKIPEILSNSNVLILPSLHEGLSYAILEAMASGCLVLANDIEGIRNLVRSGENGYLISNNSPSAYVLAIKSLRHQIWETDAVRRNSLKTAKLFSRKQFIPNYLVFIEEVLASVKRY